MPQFRPWVGEDEHDATRACFETGWLGEGPFAAQFQAALLNLITARFGVFAPSGTMALYLAMRVLDIGPGDEVIVPDFTFFSSASSVEMTGAAPVFVDVNRRNFQIDLSHADRLVNERTKAVMPVHVYGTAADMDAVMAFAGRHGILVIEDAAQALDVRYRGRHAGTFGIAGCFSFFPDKTITTGEGGFVVTDDEAVYDRLVQVRNQGRRSSGTYIHPEIGYNLRITDVQAAIGLTQLAKLAEIKRRKLHVLDRYRELLAGTGVTFFSPDDHAEWLPFRVGILHRLAHEMIEFLSDKEIEARTFFYPLHRQPPFARFVGSGDLAEDFANSDYGYDNGVCLPTFPTLTNIQIEYVCDAIRAFLAGQDQAV
ncbi:MAG TPA: DegT/DnrJ/EryC1/StrS family aminotransferase [Acidimicrobiales bacterium]|nr:DegT/DnrJ/EryC1/StrS family aminotransferase [Acidimicrobiales bacterium]